MGIFSKKNTTHDSELDPLILRQSDENKSQEILSCFESFWNYIKIPLLAISYCTVSISCVFVNKVILSPKGRFKSFGSVEFLMFLQSLLAIFFFLLFRQLKIISFPIKVTHMQFLRIATVNILFVLMTAANAYSVRFLSMPMVALLKNCQVVFVATLEYFILHTRPGKMTISSLGVIVFGSLCGSITDLEFNLVGYISMGVAILSSSLYYVVIKVAFKEQKLPELTLVFYNSILSVPYFLLTSIKKGCCAQAFWFTVNAPPVFWILILASGFTASGVNITTFLFLNATSPTAFSVLGVIKKITQTLLGYILWNPPTSISNFISVCVGVLGGILYSISKKIEKSQQVKRKRSFIEPSGFDSESRTDMLSEKDLENLSQSSKAKDEENSPFLSKLQQKMPYSPSLPAMKINHALHKMNDGNVRPASQRGNFQVSGNDKKSSNFPSSVSFPSLAANHNNTIKSKSDNEASPSILSSMNNS